jgi:hypothetical protein
MASRPSGKMLNPLPPDPARHQDSALAPGNRLEFIGSESGQCCRQTLIRPDVRFARLCENSDVELARRISVSISSLWKTDCTGNFCWEKAIEKTILRVLGSSAFSHGLAFASFRACASHFRFALNCGHWPLRGEPLCGPDERAKRKQPAGADGLDHRRRWSLWR